MALNAGFVCRVSWEGGHAARRGWRHAVPPLNVPGISGQVLVPYLRGAAKKNKKIWTVWSACRHGKEVSRLRSEAAASQGGRRSEVRPEKETRLFADLRPLISDLWVAGAARIALFRHEATHLRRIFPGRPGYQPGSVHGARTAGQVARPTSVAGVGPR